MAARLRNGNATTDYSNVVNAQAGDVERLIAASAATAAIRPTPAYAAPGSGAGFVYGANATPWKTATSTSRFTVGGSTTAGSTMRVVGVFPCLQPASQTTWDVIVVYETYSGSTYTASAMLFVYSRSAQTIQQYSAATVVTNAVATSLRVVAGVGTTATNVRLVCVSAALGSLCYTVDLSFQATILSGLQSAAAATALTVTTGANLGYLTDVGASYNPVTLSSRNAGVLCGTASIAGWLAGQLSTVGSSVGTGFAISATAASADLLCEGGPRNSLFSSNVGPYPGSFAGGHDFLGPYDASTTQLVMSIGPVKHVGESPRPGVALWAFDDTGPRQVDHLSLPDGLTFNATMTVNAINPLLAIVSYGNGATTSSALIGLQQTATQGYKLQALTSGQATGTIGVPPVFWTNYASTVGYMFEANGTQSARATPLTFSAAPPYRLVQATPLTFQLGQTLDATFRFTGGTRVDTDAVILFGATTQSAAATSNTLLLEAFSLT